MRFSQFNAIYRTAVLCVLLEACAGTNHVGSVIAPQSQIIAFANAGNQTVGTPFILSATASSGLPVSFSSATLSICAVSGMTASFIAVGTCTIQATQTGNSTYAAANPVSQTFAIINLVPIIYS